MDELQLIEKPILNWKSIQRSHKMACDKEFMGVVSYKCQYCHDNKLIELFDLMPHTILLDGHKTKRLVKYGYCDCIRKESKETDIFPMFFHIENTKTGKPIYDKSKFNYGIHKIKVMLYEFIKEMKDLKDKNIAKCIKCDMLCKDDIYYNFTRPPDDKSLFWICKEGYDIRKIEITKECGRMV